MKKLLSITLISLLLAGSTNIFCMKELDLQATKIALRLKLKTIKAYSKHIHLTEGNYNKSRFDLVLMDEKEETKGLLKKNIGELEKTLKIMCGITCQKEGYMDQKLQNIFTKACGIYFSITKLLNAQKKLTKELGGDTTIEIKTSKTIE